MATPHLDALAQDALLFDFAFCQMSVCSPSRQSFMTSRRPDTHQVWNFIDANPLNTTATPGPSSCISVSCGDAVLALHSPPLIDGSLRRRCGTEHALESSLSQLEERGLNSAVAKTMALRQATSVTTAT